MTNHNHNNNNNGPNVYGFINGNIGTAYVNPEEKGFQVHGNIGSLLNSSACFLNNIHEGILLNSQNLTDHTNTIVGRVTSENNTWQIPAEPQPPTPLLYCDKTHLSELLPFYPNTESNLHPNGIPNILLNPNCDMKLGGHATPHLAGISSAFVNNPDVLNDTPNDIGHEVNPFGIANSNGLRALGQGRNSCQKLTQGHLVPYLNVEKNINNSYIANPTTFHPDVPLYQVGNWPEKVPGNFLQEFNNNVGQGCSKLSTP